MNFRDASMIAQRIEGCVNETESRLLWSVAQYVSEHLSGCIVEIGSYHGRSATVISEAIADYPGQKLFCIDPFIRNGHDLLHTFWGNIHRYRDKVVPICGRSQEIIDYFEHSVSMLFVDGSHALDDVRDDLVRWGAMVQYGGIIIIHDYRDPVWPGVTTMADRYITDRMWTRIYDGDFGRSVLVAVKNVVEVQ